jgi:hypothetical protein
MTRKRRSAWDDMGETFEHEVVHPFPHGKDDKEEDIEEELGVT